MKITSKIFLNPVILFALLLVPGLVGAASTCNHTRVDGVSGTSITYYTLYKGGVSGLEDIRCDETPIEVTLEGSASNRLICFDPNPGFEISNWPKEVGVKKVCTEIHTEISPNIEWKGDGETYTVPFDYTPNRDIGSASPISCTGGLEYNTVCSVNFNYRDQYVVETCPLSKYICPGHSQNLTSYEQYSVNIIPEVVFKEDLTKLDVQISVTPVSTGVAQTTDATIKSGEGVQISWTTTNASEMTSCECTPDCGTSTGPTRMYYDQKIGPNKDGFLYPSASTEYIVTCR